MSKTNILHIIQHAQVKQEPEVLASIIGKSFIFKPEHPLFKNAIGLIIGISEASEKGQSLIPDHAADFIITIPHTQILKGQPGSDMDRYVANFLLVTANSVRLFMYPFHSGEKERISYPGTLEVIDMCW